MALMTAGLLSLARRIPSQTLVLCHNVLPHERSWLDTTIARLALHSATNLIVHNPRNQAEAKSLFPNAKIRVVTHPTYAAFQSENWTRESARAAIGVNGQVILFFGLVRPYKGLLDLLEALSTLKSDITLLVVGEIWGNADTYQTYVKASGVSKFVRFVNRYVSNDEAAMFFAAVDLVVLPYREATGSGVLQLAFGLGVPVIATKVGGMEDAVDDGVTGFLVEPGDINGLAQAIQRFFAEDRAEAFRAAVQRQQMRFSWAAVVDAALSLVEQVDAFR